MTAPTPTEQGTLDRIEAAPDAEESWEKRIRSVARALSDEDGAYRYNIKYWRRLAVAALNADAAFRGQP